MNPLKILEEVVKVRDQLHEMQRKIEHLRRELDVAVSEMIHFLETKNLIERK